MIFKSVLLIYWIKKRPFLGLFFFTLSTTIIFGQKEYVPLISDIQIVGNIKTHHSILKREIHHRVNIYLDSTIVQEDRNRLDNLGLFSEITWKVVPIEDGTAILIFTVIESIYFTPPLVFPTYKEDTGWSIVGLWYINNFRGMNQSFSLGGSIGGEDTYGLNFTDPWMFGDHVSLSLNVGKTLYTHRFLGEDININNIGIKVGKWFGKSIKTSIGVDIESKTFSKQEIMAEFFYLAPNATIKYDTRDIFWNPGKGVLVSQSIFHKEGIYPKDFRMTNLTQSLSWYHALNNKEKKLIVAFNGILKNKIGDRDNYWLDYFGNSSTIRGWSLPDSNLYFSGKELFRFGHESIYGSIELRQEVIPKHATSIGAELGLLIVLFADVGLISDQWKYLKDQLPIYGFGTGIRVPFPLIGSIRLDYGWGYRDGKWNTGAIHWAIGQKF